MKKKLLMTLMGMVLSLSLVACVASTNDTNVSDSDIKELQERIEELEEENAELKAALGKIEEVNTSEPETWADDYVIAFADDKFAEIIQEHTGKSKDITYGDVKDITNLKLYQCKNLSSLKYFISLEELELSNCDTTDWEVLGKLSNLKSLCIGAPNITDITVLENLTNLEELTIDGCYEIADITALGKLSNLRKLEIKSCDEIEDISAISNLTSLERLTLEKCDGLRDIDVDIFKIPSIEDVIISKCELISGDETIWMEYIGDNTWEEKETGITKTIPR